MTRGRFRWRRFAGTFAVSACLHVFWLIPALLEPIAAMSKHEVVEEVAYIPEDDLQDPTPPPPTPEVAQLDKKKKDKKPEEKKPDEKKPEPPKVAELKPVPPPPPVKVQPPPPQPPPPPIDKRKQMVTQDQFKEEQDNANAKYLAEKNHTVAEDTRMASTNLIRQTEGAKERTEESNNESKTVGMKDQKIAELEDHKGTDIARDAPQKGTEGASKDPRQTVPGPLSMRNLVPRTDVRAELQQRDGIERQETAAGDLPMMRKGADGERGGASKKGGKDVKLNLDAHMYDNIEGFATAERERREAAEAKGSHVKGRYDKYLDKVASLKSAMENFTPDVRVGNQAELGTRASPFAAYITAMHRQIHKFFTFGFLADQEMRMGKGPFDDQTLWTQVQISLNNDGTIDKVGIIHASGVTAFDAAAIDCVRSAAPFPKPPSAIVSSNGKVYMDWQFHRDERACGTFGVDPHILSNPGEGIVHDLSETGGPVPVRTKGGGTGVQNPLKPAHGGGG